MTSASSRASARARSISLWIDVPAPATGSADRERLDSVTLSIWPCVFVVRERASATGATRVSNAREKTNAGKWRAFVFRKAAREIRDARARVRRDVRHGVPARPRGAPICPA
jgi:hypothetical protein